LQQHHRGGSDNDPSEETHRITSVMVAAAQNLWRSLYRNGPLNLNSGGGGDALKLSHAADTPMRLGALCEREMIEAMARGWGRSRRLDLSYLAGGARRGSGAPATHLKARGIRYATAVWDRRSGSVFIKGAG
jgi:hypothetical protein